MGSGQPTPLGHCPFILMVFFVFPYAVRTGLYAGHQIIAQMQNQDIPRGTSVQNSGMQLPLNRVSLFHK